MKSSPVKLAVVGGNRGRAFNSTLDYLKDKVSLTCICDTDTEKIAAWQKEFSGIIGYASYDEMLEKGDFDAVFIATPIDLHFEQSIKALRAGKHVLCEVYAANTLAELNQLVATVKETGRVYAMAENYVFMRPNMLVLNMVQQGAFGDITYAEGAYIHDCRPLRFNEKGEITWRGEMFRHMRCNTYPTHSLGPVAKWMGLTEHDHMKTLSCFISRQSGLNEYVREKFGPEHPSLKPGYWKYGDSCTTVIECTSGAIITMRLDDDSPRPHNMCHYVLQGDRASYLSGRHDGEDGLVWAKGVSSENADGTAKDWDNLYKHAYKYEHPAWAAHMAAARKLGHGGGDFFVLDDFADAILTGRRPFIDVVDAAAWSSVVALSAESVALGGAPVLMPGFSR